MAVLLSNGSFSVDQIVGFSMFLGFYFSDFIGAVTIYCPIQQIFASSSRKTNVSVSGDFHQDPPWAISVHLSDFCCYTNFCCSLTFDKGKRHGLLHHPDNRYGLVHVHLSQHPPADPHSAMPSVNLASHFSVPHTSIFMVSQTHLCMFLSCSICVSRSHSSICEDQATCCCTQGGRGGPSNGCLSGLG